MSHFLQVNSIPSFQCPRWAVCQQCSGSGNRSSSREPTSAWNANQQQLPLKGLAGREAAICSSSAPPGTCYLTFLGWGEGRLCHICQAQILIQEVSWECWAGDVKVLLISWQPAPELTQWEQHILQALREEQYSLQGNAVLIWKKWRNDKQRSSSPSSLQMYFIFATGKYSLRCCRTLEHLMSPSPDLLQGENWLPAVLADDCRVTLPHCFSLLEKFVWTMGKLTVPGREAVW